MDVSRTSVINIFEAKQRLEIPLFQRQYVWNENDQWQPLWEDIERKFIEALEARQNAPKHFLGAMVLDQKQTPTGHVVVRLVIDGQQRLTTLQIFLAALRDFARSVDCGDLANEVEQALFNRGMMSDPEIDRFKVWPTQLDRQQFVDVVDSGSYEEVLKRHPDKRKKYARKRDPKPRMVEAYLFFFDKLQAFFEGEDGEAPLASDHLISQRLDECFQALKNALLVAVIDLDRDDDPQVIFETLNARGQPLLPADLIRNYIFLRARREAHDADALYKAYWSSFDDEFWREEIKQGRLKRPRSDLFIQHLLASRQARDIPIKHLYVEYRHWSESVETSMDVPAELELLSEQGVAYRRLLDPEDDDPVAPLAAFLRTFEVGTLYPLVLGFFETNPSDEEWQKVTQYLESFIVRRAVCEMTTKNYNRLFLSVLRSLRNSEFSAQKLYELLSSQTGESGLWPDDARFKEGILQREVYHSLGSARLVHIFSRLNDCYASNKSERLSFKEKPTVEHIMPQKWIKHWPLPNGEKGVESLDLLFAEDDDERARLTRQRDRYVNRLGNLTILSHGLNSAQSNLNWPEKRPELMKHSLLPLNQPLAEKDHWNEEEIDKRGSELFLHAKNIWQR